MTKPTLTWKTSKTPTKTVVNGVTLANPATTSYTLTADITANKTVTLTVTDEAGGTDSKYLAWAFGYGVYQGMATVPSELTQEWVKTTLSGKQIKTSVNNTSYTMKGSTTQYWWIAAPMAWTIEFSTSLGSGGAYKYGEVAGFVNDQGEAVPMSVYRAEQIQGGDMKITVVQK